MARAIRLRSLLPCLLAPLLLACSGLHADIIHLKNGKTLHGEVVREDADTVTIKVPFGEVKLRKSEVEAIERQTSTEYRLDLGRELLQQRNYGRAVAALEEACSADRANAESRRVLAGAYETQGRHLRDLHRFNEACAAFEKLLKLDPRAELIPHHAAEALRELKGQQSSVDEMSRKARRLAAAQEWDQAIKLYQEIVAFSPDARALVSAGMARCYVNRAVERSQSGQAMNAAADLEAALGLDPALADRVEKFYTSCALPLILNNLAAGNVKDAEVDLKRVLSFAPTNKTVLYVAARLEEAFARLPGAAGYYARALHTRVGNPTPEYTARLRQQLEKEIGVSGNRWQIDTEIARADEYAQSFDGPPKTLEGDNFTVVYYNEALARQVLEAAEYHRARIQRELGLPHLWTGRAKIYLHRTQAEYTARTGQPEWTGGFSKFNFLGGVIADPQIHSWQTSPRLLKSVLPHEITHVCVASNVADFQALPRCLHEGFAVLMEPQFRHDYFANFLRVRLRSQNFIPLADLLTSHDYPKDPEFFYAEGYSILNYLVKQKGLPATAELLKCGNLSEVQAELLKLSGARSLDDLESGWKKWILSSK